MKNETITPTPATASNAIALTEKQKLSIANKAVSDFQKAYTRANASTWEVAKVVFKTVTDVRFKEVFGKMGDYAKALSVSQSALSNMVKSFNAREFVRTNSALLTKFDIDNIDNMSIGQWQEIGAIKQDELIDFINCELVLSTDSVRDLREKVKAYKEVGDAIDVDADEVDATDNATTEDATTEDATPANDEMTIKYGDRVVILKDSDYEIIAQILTLIDGK